jgi:flagellar hook-associated protein 1 FlgK
VSAGTARKGPRNRGLCAGIAIADKEQDQKPSRHRVRQEQDMTVGSILQSALSALQVNQAALNTTASNIANLNSPGFKRRVVDLQPQLVGSTESGVEIADVKRATATYLAEQSLNVTSATAQYEAVSGIHDSVQNLLGSPSDNTSLSGALDKVFTSIRDLSADASSVIKRTSLLTQLSALGQTYSDLAGNLQSLRANADLQISAKTTQVNTLLQQIDDLNPQIQQALVTQGEANGLQDARDQAVSKLAELMDIRVSEQGNGKLYVMTQDGVPLVTEQLYQLDYPSGGMVSASSGFGPITIKRYDPLSNQLVPPATNLAPHLGSGSLRGLLDMRDQTLPDLADQVGELAGQVADALNAAHNASTAVPPPQSLTGRDTGLLGTDANGFTGKTSFAVVDTTGALVTRVDVDFGAGTYSVDGGAATAFSGSSIANMVAGINAGLGSNGSMSFANGVLSVQATGSGNGIAIVDDPTTPATRGGHGFSQTFGLNDLFTASRPTNFDTGLTAADPSGFAAGQTIRMVLQGPNGETAADFTYTMTGASLGGIISDLNTAGTGLGGYVNFALDGAGRLTATPTAAFNGYKLQIVDDQTSRGTTGIAFSQLFGFGMGAQAEQAQNLRVVSRIANSPSVLATAKVTLAPTTVPGNSVLGAGDNSGVLALAAAQDGTFAFHAAGNLGAVKATLGTFAGNVLANAGTLASQADTLYNQNQNLKSDVDQRVGSIEGVNLDEELSNMLLYQKSYNAAARLITTATEIFDQLLKSI